jgi:glycerol-1-phosphate dehydrogenase [NAD(P)+]
MEKIYNKFGVKHCVVAGGAIAQAVDWISATAKNPIVISDCNTQKLVPQLAKFRQHIFDVPPKPQKEIAEMFAQKDADYFIGVGSGTISDIVKYASFLSKKPYVMIATAPSMNGYLSITASLIENNKKESHQAHLPVALFADLDILAAAPLRLIRSGVGDSICRSTAQADWLLSHLLLGTEYISEAFLLTKQAEEKTFEYTNKLMRGGKDAHANLMNLLLLSGLAMTLCKGSYPASQGEHMIAHHKEMLYGDQMPETFHGEQIGVTTLIMAEIQERVLAQKTLQLSKPLPQKGINLSNMHELNRKLATDWLDISQKIKNITIPHPKIMAILNSINAPFSAEMLGWRDDWLKKALPQTHTTRNRFTFLDLQALTIS